MLITHQQKGNTMTVSLTKEAKVVRVTKDTSEFAGFNLEVERVTPRNAVVCYVPNQGYRTYQQGEYEIVV